MADHGPCRGDARCGRVNDETGSESLELVGEGERTLKNGGADDDGCGTGAAAGQRAVVLLDGLEAADGRSRSLFEDSELECGLLGVASQHSSDESQFLQEPLAELDGNLANNSQASGSCGSGCGANDGGVARRLRDGGPSDGNGERMQLDLASSAAATWLIGIVW